MATEVSSVDIWAEADEALVYHNRETGDDMLAHGEDADELFTNPNFKLLPGKPTFTLDSDGDVHVCFGMHCPHAALDRDKNWVCTASGNVVGVECAREYDKCWTGRSSKSANPDDSAGTPVGGWVKKRDMYAASVAAYRSAHEISADEVAMPPPPKPDRFLVPVKRGALCVDEEAVEPLSKRPRSSRKEPQTNSNKRTAARSALNDTS